MELEGRGLLVGILAFSEPKNYLTPRKHIIKYLLQEGIEASSVSVPELVLMKNTILAILPLNSNLSFCSNLTY